jgi:hypothetical protein
MLPLWLQPLYKQRGYFTIHCYGRHAPGSRLPGSLEIRQADGHPRRVSWAFRVIGRSTVADYLCEVRLAGGPEKQRLEFPEIAAAMQKASLYFYRVAMRPQWQMILLRLWREHVVDDFPYDDVEN